MANSSTPTTIAIFGATGSTGSATLRSLLSKKDLSLHLRILVRSKDKLTKLVPELLSHPSCKIWEGNLTDTETIKDCLNGADVVICTVGENRNIPGVDVIQTAAKSIVTGLRALREQQQAGRTSTAAWQKPRLLLLSSVTWNKRILESGFSPIRFIVKRAFYYPYADLLEAHRIFDEAADDDLLTLLLVQPPALIDEAPTGYEISVDKSRVGVSYADLGAGFAELATESAYDQVGAVIVTSLGGDSFASPGLCVPIRPRLTLVETWMFLNTIQKDFDHDLASPSDASDREDICSISPKAWHASPVVPPSKAHHAGTLHRSLANIQMNSIEGHLWSYFDEYMTPQCVLTPDCNPYRNVILRLASSSQRGPLFHCVLAVAANQLHSIGLRQYQQFMWLHRAEALRELRRKVNAAAAAPGGLDQTPDFAETAQITASTLMLCFFEVDPTGLFSKLDCPYYIRPNILVTILPQFFKVCRFCTSADDATVLALAGCSTELLAIISEINSLDTIVKGRQPQNSVNDKMRRDDIERRLHSQGRMFASSAQSPDLEVSIIAEVKRLAAMLYLYGRIDGASPQETHMVRITKQTLALIPQISLRTNTILWPLFIVAVLGVRPECDEDRRLILARLTALQETRQLGNVKKARCVIEDVWKARDLRASDATKGWKILEGKHQTISLA
ncbi:hypothetical protein PFICI_10912 [Pestalotiopsis fici W106-1]|uniref:NAD(P)-binding domain-containing protein n=1 Tax=Pestalotiopsis fici (strain W106-1 / CGMCC3.15140) TaxID=1229662 RepID=W3WT36_PESFW|nr:uncharacterized protein PFICI_10912 [Pestalotiopsis fici W106-1]ETS77038.1 hypothetical protein PFICI_10912 [Pestalotiopsis fici W106-1]